MTPEFLALQHFDYAVVDRFATPYPALESLLAKGVVVARFPSTGGAADVIGDAFHGPALTLFTMPQMGPEILIVKLKQ